MMTEAELKELREQAQVSRLPGALCAPLPAHPAATQLGWHRGSADSHLCTQATPRSLFSEPGKGPPAPMAQEQKTAPHTHNGKEVPPSEMPGFLLEAGGVRRTIRQRKAEPDSVFMGSRCHRQAVLCLCFLGSPSSHESHLRHTAQHCLHGKGPRT